MKNHFPEDYCPQREKVLDLSRVILSGGRQFARNRRIAGRDRENQKRQRIRAVLREATSWPCECDLEDVDFCRRCEDDVLPTVSETFGSFEKPLLGWRLCNFVGSGYGDDLGPLFNWYNERTKDMTHQEACDFLRSMFRASPFGNSLKTRHACRHLSDKVRQQFDTVGSGYRRMGT